MMEKNAQAPGNPAGDFATKKNAQANGHFSIRNAENSDLPRMLEIYAHARKFMAENGNPRQWGITGWPPGEVLEKDIRSGSSYVCEISEDGKSDAKTGKRRVVGTFFFAEGPHIEKTYDDISDGEWLSSVKCGEAGNTYGVVHRLAGDGSVKGIGAFCLNWAYEKSGHLRVDTHPDNKVMQGLLEKLGFIRCGTVHAAEDDDPRIAYEKL